MSLALESAVREKTEAKKAEKGTKHKQGKKPISY